MNKKVKAALIMALSGVIVAFISTSNTSDKQPTFKIKQTSYNGKSQNIQGVKGNVNINFAKGE